MTRDTWLPQVLVAVTVTLLHAHRLVILRRVWFLLGILYFYRAVTMSVVTRDSRDSRDT